MSLTPLASKHAIKQAWDQATVHKAGHAMYDAKWTCKHASMMSADLSARVADAGYFPVKLQALPEGTCVHAHVPVYQVG